MDDDTQPERTGLIPDPRIENNERIEESESESMRAQRK